MRKVRYEGTAPGQAATIRVDGETYIRGRVYRVTKSQAATLARKGGFSAVYDKPKPAAPKAIAATIEE